MRVISPPLSLPGSLGHSGRLTPSTNVYLRYQGDFGRDGQDSHAVSAAARIAF